MAFETLGGSCHKTVGKVRTARIVTVVGRTVAAEVGTVGAPNMLVLADKVVGLEPNQPDQIFQVVHFVSVHAHLALTVGLVTSVFCYHHLMANGTFLLEKRVTILSPLGRFLAIRSLTLSKDSISWKVEPTRVT